MTRRLSSVRQRGAGWLPVPPPGPAAEPLRECRLYLADPSGVAPFEQLGEGRLLPSGWLEFQAYDAPVDVAAVSYPPQRVRRVEWLVPALEVTR
jgi:hypothetical protein